MRMILIKNKGRCDCLSYVYQRIDSNSKYDGLFVCSDKEYYQTEDYYYRYNLSTFYHRDIEYESQRICGDNVIELRCR